MGRVIAGTALAVLALAYAGRPGATPEEKDMYVKGRGTLNMVKVRLEIFHEKHGRLLESSEDLNRKNFPGMKDLTDPFRVEYFADGASRYSGPAEHLAEDRVRK